MSVVRTEAPWVRRTLIAVALIFMALFLVLPLAAVFTEALRKGWDAYWEALKEPDAWSAIRLTLITAAVAVPLNLVFGVAAAWAVAKFEFRGKSTLLTSTAPRYGFVGFEPDVAFGTYAFGRRVYDPSLRRWLSPDPLAAADPEAVTIPELDLWGYAGANPVRNVDPAGTCISDTCFDRNSEAVLSMSPDEKRTLADVVSMVMPGGDIMLKRAVVVPLNEGWAHEPEMKSKLSRADAWMRKNLPAETDVDQLEAKLDK